MEFQVEQPGKRTLKLPTKRCANVGRASRKDEKLLNTPAKQDSSPQTRRDKKGATSDPHDEMAPQKIGEILDGGWARKGIVVTRPEEQLLIATDMQDHPRASPKVASSRLSLQMHCPPLGQMKTYVDVGYLCGEGSPTRFFRHPHPMLSRTWG